MVQLEHAAHFYLVKVILSNAYLLEILNMYWWDGLIFASIFSMGWCASFSYANPITPWHTVWREVVSSLNVFPFYVHTLRFMVICGHHCYIYFFYTLLLCVNTSSSFMLCYDVIVFNVIFITPNHHVLKETKFIYFTFLMWKRCNFTLKCWGLYGV